jgi:hypothetical protein
MRTFGAWVGSAMCRACPFSASNLSSVYLTGAQRPRASRASIFEIVSSRVEVEAARGLVQPVERQFGVPGQRLPREVGLQVEVQRAGFHLVVVGVAQRVECMGGGAVQAEDGAGGGAHEGRVYGMREWLSGEARAE